MTTMPDPQHTPVAPTSGATGDDLPQDPVILTKDAATQRRLRLATIDVRTGGCPPVMVDNIDLANDFIGTMPLKGRAHLALYAEQAETDPARHQVPQAHRAALQASLKATVQAVEMHERFGGRIRVLDEHFGSDPRNRRRTTSWLYPDDELRIAARRWDFVADFYQQTHGLDVEFVEERDFDVHYGYGPGVETFYVSAIRLLDDKLLRPKRVDWGEGDYRMHFERQLTDGGTHTWSADPDDVAEVYHDKDGLVHRDDGPAMIDEHCVEYRRHGITHRDRSHGPAVIGSDGSAHFVENGRNVDAQIFPGQARTHNLVADPEVTSGWRIDNRDSDFDKQFDLVAAYYQGELP